MREDEVVGHANQAWMSDFGRPERGAVWLPALINARRHPLLLTLTGILGAACGLAAIVLLAPNLDAASASPAASGRLHWIAFGAAGGVAVAIALAQIMEAAAERLMSARDIATKSNLRPLGAAPHADARLLRRLSPGERHGAGLVAGAPASRFAQAYRELFDDIQNRRNLRAIKTIALTSSYNGEETGVSYLALARTAALAGERAIIVDCDARARVLSRLVRLDKTNGLEAILAGRARWQDLAQRDSQTSLDLIPMGARRDLLADMFTSTPFESLLAFLCEDYDLVILACPPILAAVDASTLARIAEATVLFVGGDAKMRVSRLRAVQRKLQNPAVWTLGAFLVNAPQ